MTVTYEGITSNEVTVTVSEPAPTEKGTLSLNAGAVYEQGDKRYVNVTLDLDKNVGTGLHTFLIEVAYDSAFTLTNINKKKLVKQAGDLLPYNISANPAVETENGIRFLYINEEDVTAAEGIAFTDDTANAPLLTMVFEVADGVYGQYPISFVSTDTLPDFSDAASNTTTDQYNFIDGTIDLGEEPAAPVITGIELRVDNVQLGIGEETTYTVVAIYDNGTEEDVEADDISGLEGIVELTATGLKGVLGGTAALTATYGEFTSDAVEITVTKAIVSIALSVDNTELSVNGETAYTVTATYDDGTTEEITNAQLTGLDDILELSDTGLKGVLGGTATLTAVYGEFTSNEVEVTVTKALASILLSIDTTVLDIDDETAYTVTATYDDGTTDDITDATIDGIGDILEITETGLKAVKAGEATVTASYAGLTSNEITVTVNEAPAPVVNKKGNVLNTDEDVNMNDITRLAQYLAKWSQVVNEFDDNVKYSANVYRADQYYFDEDGTTKIADWDADFGANPNNAFLFLNSKDITKLMQYVNDLGAVEKTWNVDLNAAN